MIRRVTLVALLVSLMPLPAAYASIAKVNLSSLGALGMADDGFNVTVDLDNKVQWLDFTLTVNRSYLDVTGNLLGAGNLLEGWRYATAQDWLNLAISAGVPADRYGTIVANDNNAAHETLKSALGLTWEGFSAVAITGESFSSNSHAIGSFGALLETEDIVQIPVDGGVPFESRFRDFRSSAQLGSALVRNIPEPTSIVVWVLLGAVGLKRRLGM